jgi:hypothetical protein
MSAAFVHTITDGQDTQKRAEGLQDLRMVSVKAIIPARRERAEPVLFVPLVSRSGNGLQA